MVKRKGWTKALAGAALACAMAISLAPAGSAMAIGDLESWEAPTAKSALGYTADGKDYTYITSATRKVSESTADVLGISNVTVCPTAGNPFTYQGTAEEIFNSIKSNARFGIYGSDVNQNMNPYYANYFYDKSKGGAEDLTSRDMTLVDNRISKGAPNAAYTTVADEYGTSPILYYRPDILYGVSSNAAPTITTKDTNEVVSYGTATSCVSGYTELVDKIRAKTLDGADAAELVQEGDENYDPYYVTYNMTGYTTGIVDNLYSLASAAEGVIERTANTDNPKVTRYEDPLEIATKFEAYLLGTQDAVLAAIDSKKVDRKTIGVVGAVSADEPVIYFWPGVSETGSYSRDYTEFLGAVTDNIADTKNLEIVEVDGTKYAKGTAADLMACDVIYIAAGDGGTGNGERETNVKDALNNLLVTAGYTDEANYPAMNVYTPKTVLHHNRGGSVENAVLLGSLVGFAYPEVVNPVYSLAYFYENFYHIKDSRLDDAMGMNLTGMSLPAGVDLSLEGYMESDYDSMLNQGLTYYFNNKKAIDEAHPTLVATNEEGLLSYMVAVSQAENEKAQAEAAAAKQAAEDAEAAKAEAEESVKKAEADLAKANDDKKAAEDAKAQAEADLQKANEDKAAAEDAKAQAEADLQKANEDKAAAEEALAAALAAKEKAEAELAETKAATAPLDKVKLTSKTKSTKAGKVTVAWNKVDGATGYEVKIGSKVYSVKGGNVLSKTVKAKKGAKVKVKARAYKAQGDNTLFGKWSNTKKVVVKK